MKKRVFHECALKTVSGQSVDKIIISNDKRHVLIYVSNHDENYLIGYSRLYDYDEIEDKYMQVEDDMKNALDCAAFSPDSKYLVMFSFDVDIIKLDGHFKITNSFTINRSPPFVPVAFIHFMSNTMFGVITTDENKDVFCVGDVEASSSDFGTYDIGSIGKIVGFNKSGTRCVTVGAWIGNGTTSCTLLDSSGCFANSQIDFSKLITLWTIELNEWSGYTFVSFANHNENSIVIGQEGEGGECYVIEDGKVIRKSCSGDSRCVFLNDSSVLVVNNGEMQCLSNEDETVMDKFLGSKIVCAFAISSTSDFLVIAGETMHNQGFRFKLYFVDLFDANQVAHEIDCVYSALADVLPNDIRRNMHVFLEDCIPLPQAVEIRKIRKI